MFALVYCAKVLGRGLLQFRFESRVYACSVLYITIMAVNNLCVIIYVYVIHLNVYRCNILFIQYISMYMFGEVKNCSKPPLPTTLIKKDIFGNF